MKTLALFLLVTFGPASYTRAVLASAERGAMQAPKPVPNPLREREIKDLMLYIESVELRCKARHSDFTDFKDQFDQVFTTRQELPSLPGIER